MSALIEYKEKFGDTMVPRNYTHNPSLAKCEF